MFDYLRPAVRSMAGYTPGEQPRQGDVIKLNTNENPYPPSPKVFDAVREMLTGDRFRKYPDPVGTQFRHAAARVLDVDPEGIVIGNGSDDILTILTRAFVPEGGLVVSPTPSYLLYRTLAALQGARFETVAYQPDWSLPTPWPAPQANLTFIANPNSPSGTCVSLNEIERLTRSVHGAVVVDEAYADFGDTHAVALARAGKVIVSRSFSKSHALAGIRFGYAVTTPEVATQLVKVKDSYNCDVLSLAAATAAIEDQDYASRMRDRVVATRTRLAHALADLGFTVTPSQANFVWSRRADRPVKPIFEELKRRNILVRYMVYEGYGDGLRVSVGTDLEIDRLLEELRSIV